MRNGAEEIAWVLPELQRLAPRLAMDPKSDSRASRYRLFDSIALLIEKLTVRSPLAIFIDDLHEADQVSLILFEHLAVELAGTRTFLFGTFRTHGSVYRNCARMVASVLRRSGSELVTLSGLSAHDIAILAEFRFGTRATATAVRSVFAKTNGNPLFVLQLLQVLENDGRLECLSKEGPLEYSIPRGVRDAIARQTDALPPGGCPKNC